MRFLRFWCDVVMTVQTPKLIHAVACAILLTCAPVQAEGVRITPEMVESALEAQGYKVASTTRTLLGRVRIVASLDLLWREVVLDPSTGQILRDYAVEFTPATAPDADRDTMPRGGRVLSAFPETDDRTRTLP